MNRRNQGFTLVEILIVVIILGILAAIVIPQFTEASNDARESSLTSDLQTLRSQIELFKIQHGDQYPGTDWGDNSSDDFVTDLTSALDYNGRTYGPYLQSFPTNPFNNLSTVNVAAGAPAGDDSTGWHFNSTTGKISPNSSGTTAGGTAHKDL